jgi:hypothetical protein
MPTKLFGTEYKLNGFLNKEEQDSILCEVLSIIVPAALYLLGMDFINRRK